MNRLLQKLYGMAVLIILFFVVPQKGIAQLKTDNGFSLATGVYSSEGFGSNLFGALRYNHYLNQGRHFFEASLGLSSLQSDVLRSVANATLFENERLLVYEFIYGYDPKMWTSFPYLTAGFAGLNQGGQSKFAVVLGLGNRLYFDTLFGSPNIGLRYDLRDHIVSQSFNEKKSFIAHNIVFTLNLEFFY
ncbi:MAG: hypothetical protein H6627_02685 [Calditrichae bacterium]|nr:hypothetical protein [Calditrichota bacterium]MCB9057441.1 hypothetical protein [Calditrichia bacterium]